MAKSRFTATELECWNSIYGPSRGPTPGRLRILVEEFAARGLIPVMMRLGSDMLPYSASGFQTAIREACLHKDDDQVQVYYHPADCERVVGSTGTTWTQWATLVLYTTGILPGGWTPTHPAILENVPRVRLPVEVRNTLVARGVTTSSMCSLVSARMAAFFIAAQYEAWATAEEVSRVAPFKATLKYQGYTVRDVIVRKDTGVDEILRDLEIPEIPSGELLVEQLRADMYHAQDMSNIASELQTDEDRLLDAMLRNDTSEDEVETIDGAGETDIDAEIRATEAHLAVLKERKLAAETRRQNFLSARVADVKFEGTQVTIFLRMPSGDQLAFRLI